MLPLLLALLSFFAVAVHGSVVIFQPPASYVYPKTLYARSVLLGDGSILATWEDHPSTKAVTFPIFKSSDQGKSWTKIGHVTDQVNNWGFLYEPHLYELKKSMGGFPPGTVLVVGNSIPADRSKTKLDLYASRDGGKSWVFVSSIASGGRGFPNNGETPVWEGFLMEYGGKLLCYYSDQRDPKYGQKIVHASSSDLKSWSGPVDDVTASKYDFRPGMPVVSLMGNGEYIMTYEFFGAPEALFAVYYKRSKDPTQFGNAVGQAVKTTTGLVPTSTPYNVFTKAGGSKGTLVVSSASSDQLFINHNFGVGPWTTLDIGANTGYSRGLAIGGGSAYIDVLDGGPLAKGTDANNRVTFTRVPVPSAPRRRCLSGKSCNTTEDQS